MRGCFYDTWAFLALANAGDPDHHLSVEADRRLEQGGYAAVTSDYILDEAITALHAAAGFAVALQFIAVVEAQIEGRDLLLVEVNGPRRARALELFRRLGKETPRLSFTDCTSFAVMRELQVTLAFTADAHFHRAGGGIRPLFTRRGKALSLELPPGA